MALILNIDTATEIAIISISENNTVTDFVTNSNQKDHASFLHPAIKALLEKNDLSINKISAIAVTSGPGSYTGVRVAMAAAKGLCYALNIPLITISTLELLALATIQQVKDEAALYCPLIDARRMEVFTAVYNYDLEQIMEPCSMILTETSFNDLLKTNKIYFSGSGITKLKQLVDSEKAVFRDHEVSPAAIAKLSYENYIKQDFKDVSYSAPTYLKEFYTVAKKGA